MWSWSFIQETRVSVKKNLSFSFRVRPGGSSVLSCRSSLPVSSCLWRTPKGKLFSLGEGQTAEGGRVAFEAKFEEGENVEEARRRWDIVLHLYFLLFSRFFLHKMIFIGFAASVSTT